MEVAIAVSSSREIPTCLLAAEPEVPLAIWCTVIGVLDDVDDVEL